MKRTFILVSIFSVFYLNGVAQGKDPQLEKL
jgi:hypothetical protein